MMSFDSDGDYGTGEGAVDGSGNHTCCSSQGGTWIDHSYFTNGDMADLERLSRLRLCGNHRFLSNRNCGYSAGVGAINSKGPLALHFDYVGPIQTNRPSRVP